MKTEAPLFPQHGRFPYRWHVLFIGQQMTLHLRIQIAPGKVVRWRTLIPLQRAKKVPVGDLREGRKLVDQTFKDLLGGLGILDWKQRWLSEPALDTAFPDEAYFPPNHLFQGQKDWGYRIELDRGEAQMGAQRPTNAEYFLDKGGWYRGRLVFSKLSRSEVTDQLTEVDVRVLGADEELWWMNTTREQAPLVVYRTPDDTFELPKGFSALPEEVRVLLPENLHYWNGKGTVEAASKWLKGNVRFPTRRGLYELVNPYPVAGKPAKPAQRGRARKSPQTPAAQPSA